MLRNKIIFFATLLLSFSGYMLFVGQREIKAADICSGSARFRNDRSICVWRADRPTTCSISRRWNSVSCRWEWPGYGTPGSTWACGAWAHEYTTPWCDIRGRFFCTAYYTNEYVFRNNGCRVTSSTPAPTPVPTPAPAPDPSCTVNLDPFDVDIGQGTDANYIASVSNIQNGSVSQVNFSSSNTSIATISPTSDASSPYQTVGDTLSVGSTTITADVVMSGATRCSDTATLDVTAPGPWWQIIDSDIITNGDIISSIPLSCTLPGCNPLLGLEGLGGFPGVPIYGGFTASFGEGDVSSTGWLASSETLFSKIYDYRYFSRLVRPDVTLTEIQDNSINGGFFASGGTPKRGFVWYHFDGDSDINPGDLAVSSINMPSDRRVVVLIENADLYLNGAINVNDGEGFIMFIVGKKDNGDKGNIYIADDIPGQDEIEGVFLAEGQFRTGTGSDPLYVRGMVAAYDGIVLERDLEGDNVDTPAEVFEFAPDFILNFPRDLTFKRLRWKEVAP